MFGILNVNKRSGITSRDVVNRVQRIVRPAKVGHAGTLDPLASGVLVIGVGPATRLIEYIQRGRKRYRGTFLLGRQSDTEDVEGDVHELLDPPIPLKSEILQACDTFVGELMQRPPVYSALKLKGKRAYELARKGQAVELESRPVRIHRLELVSYDYPEFQIDIECDGGTYVRSLGRDIADAVGTSAVMSKLVRSGVGPFTLQAAVNVDALSNFDDVREHLQPAATATCGLEQVVLNSNEQHWIADGLRIERDDLLPADEYAAIDDEGNLLAILIREADGRIRATKNFRR